MEGYNGEDMAYYKPQNHKIWERQRLNVLLRENKLKPPR